MSDIATIKEIDQALEKYYNEVYKNKNSKRKVNVYKNKEGKGKFELYCDDNGFEDADIAEELDAGPQDCSLVDFDEEFPLEPTIEDPVQRNNSIYKIIKYCADNKEPPPNQSLDINQIKLNIDENAKKKGTKIYKKQLSCLGALGAKEPALMHFFAVGYANNKIPFLPLMVDSYTKDRTKYFRKHRKMLEVTRWCRASGNRYMSALKAHDKKTADLLENGIRSYCNRIMSGIQFQPLHKVQDSIRDIVAYIVAVPKLIKVLIDGHKASPPFQLDLLIAVRSVKDTSNFVNETDDDDDDDDLDDSEEEKEHKETIYEQKEDDASKDHIGDVHKKLDGVPCGYFPRDLFEVDDYKSEVDALTRYLAQKFNGFRSYLQNKKRKGHHDDDDDDKKNDDDPQKGFDSKTYPQRKRFCIFIDRRNQIKNKEKKDEMTFFEPPHQCDTLPKDHVAEWYFESTRQCLIPRAGFTGDLKKENEHNQTAQIDDKTITSQDGICGQLMTFSFHVEEADQIKCYIIWNGQTMRFHGEYLRQVLPLLFVDDKEKKLFIQDKQMDEIEKSFAKIVQDKTFKDFYNDAKIMD